MRQGGDGLNPRHARAFPTGNAADRVKCLLCRHLRSPSVAAHDRRRKTEQRGFSNWSSDPLGGVSLNGDRRYLRDWAATHRRGAVVEDQRIHRNLRRCAQENDRRHLAYTGLTLDEEGQSEDLGLGEWMGELGHAGSHLLTVPLGCVYRGFVGPLVVHRSAPPPLRPVGGRHYCSSKFRRGEKL